MLKKTVRHRKVKSGNSETLEPALGSWIKNVIVPILVSDYVEGRKRNNAERQPAHFLDSGTPIMRDCA